MKSEMSDITISLRTLDTELAYSKIGQGNMD